MFSNRSDHISLPAVVICKEGFKDLDMSVQRETFEVPGIGNHVCSNVTGDEWMGCANRTMYSLEDVVEFVYKSVLRRQLLLH